MSVHTIALSVLRKTEVNFLPIMLTCVTNDHTHFAFYLHSVVPSSPPPFTYPFPSLLPPGKEIKALIRKQTAEGSSSEEEEESLNTEENPPRSGPEPAVSTAAVTAAPKPSSSSKSSSKGNYDQCGFRGTLDDVHVNTCVYDLASIEILC